MSQRLDLLSNASATPSVYTQAVGGRYIWTCEGTFGGATLQLQGKTANGTAIDVLGASMTANGALEVMIADGSELRVTVTGGSPSALYSYLVSVGA
jgi:hypothetical protein